MDSRGAMKSDSIALTTADAGGCNANQARHRSFAKICQKGYCSAMSTMNISLPDSLKDFIDEQVDQRGFGTSSEYIRELIRKEQERLQLRGLLLAGASSAPTKPVDGAYFDGLRKKVRAIKPGARR
jgi:antitoxin ParD1/3/4